MKFPFFGRRDKGSQREGENDDKAIIASEETEIAPVVGNENIDLNFYDHVTFDVVSAGGGAYVDALIPMIANAADAAAQWDHAIVRFPEGAGWNDLLNRKTPGWEEWKQLGILKEGKFQPQAAIRQAKLQPVAVANLALQGAAIVVGQAYMAEISKQLEGIELGIAAIQQEMRIEREADIEARFEKLIEYLVRYDEISTNLERKQAVRNVIEDICVEALKAWKFQIKAMEEFVARIEHSKRLKDDELRAMIREFQGKERDAQVAFRLFLAAERASMQYDDDFTVARIACECEKVEKCLGEYALARDRAQDVLAGKIEDVRGGLLAVPQVKDDDYESRNPVLGAVHFVALNASRVTPAALRREARRRSAIKKGRYSRAVSVDDPIALIGKECEDELARMDFIYNKADAMLIDEKGVHFLSTRKKGFVSEVAETAVAEDWRSK